MSSGNARADAARPRAGSRTPQRRRGHTRVAGLMAAAAELFVEKGFDATTMTEIAAHAGGSIGSLYLFFPTKAALAQAMLAETADALSRELDALAARVAGWSAPAMADALFDTLGTFLAAHPQYAVLVDQRGDEAWRAAIRSRRRQQIADLFAKATPSLAAGQPDRLAIVVPHLMRITMVLAREVPAGERGPVLDELRTMLRHHLSQD